MLGMKQEDFMCGNDVSCYGKMPVNMAANSPLPMHTCHSTFKRGACSPSYQIWAEPVTCFD